MKWIIKYYLIYIFLCVPFLINATSISPEFSKADSLFEHGEFIEAATYYEWINYFEEEKTIRALAQIKRIDCFMQLDQFEEAQFYAEKISLINIPDSLAFIIRFKRSINAYLAENFNEAKSHFIQLKFYHPKKVYEPESFYLNILILNELREWENAKSEFIDWIEKSNQQQAIKDSLLNIVNQLYYAKNIPKLKSIEKARLFSSLVPGSG
jgi:tetratricopeptide (TPR) repeat protein